MYVCMYVCMYRHTHTPRVCMRTLQTYAYKFPGSTNKVIPLLPCIRIQAHFRCVYVCVYIHTNKQTKSMCICQHIECKYVYTCLGRLKYKLAK